LLPPAAPGRAATISVATDFEVERCGRSSNHSIEEANSRFWLGRRGSVARAKSASPQSVLSRPHSNLENRDPRSFWQQKDEAQFCGALGVFCGPAAGAMTDNRRASASSELPPQREA